MRPCGTHFPSPSFARRWASRAAAIRSDSDNDPEFIALAVRDWIARRGFKTLYIKPGAPWQNASVCVEAKVCSASNTATGTTKSARISRWVTRRPWGSRSAASATLRQSQSCAPSTDNPQPQPRNQRKTLIASGSITEGRPQVLAQDRSKLRPPPACPWWRFLWSLRSTVRVGDDGAPRSRLTHCIFPDGDIFFLKSPPAKTNLALILLRSSAF